jgi:hypothetical protein
VIDFVAWLLAFALLGWASVRLAGLERGSPLVQLLAFTPYVPAVALVVVLPDAVTGRWAPAALSAIAAVTLAAVVIPTRVLGSSADIRCVTSDSACTARKENVADE